MGLTLGRPPEIDGLVFVALAKGMKESASDAVVKAAHEPTVRVHGHPRGWLTEKTGSDNHQGVAASTGQFKYSELIDLIEASQLFELDRRGSQVVVRDKRQGRPVRA